MKNEIALVQSRTFWVSALGLIALVANQFHLVALAGFAADPATVTNILNFVTFAGVAGAMLFRAIANAKVTSVLPPSATLPPGALKAGVFLLAVVLAGGALSGLSGCAAIQSVATLSGFSVTQNEIDALRSTYDGAFLTPAAQYRQLGFCATGTSATLAKPCADRTIVGKLVAADQIVESDFNSVQALVTAGNNSGLAAAYQVLQNQISTAESLVISLGVTTK